MDVYYICNNSIHNNEYDRNILIVFQSHHDGLGRQKRHPFEVVEYSSNEWNEEALISILIPVLHRIPRRKPSNRNYLAGMLWKYKK